MTIDTAEKHADSMLEDIRRRSDSGAPFGWINRETEEWVGDEPEGWADDIDSEWTEASGYDYLSDVLDIQYIVSGDRAYRAARILVGFGGPNVWINTQTGNLEVGWWSELVYRSLPRDFVSGLDDAIEELWSCN